MIVVTLYCRHCGEEVKPNDQGELPLKCTCESRSFSSTKPHGLGATEREVKFDDRDRYFLWRNGIKAD